MCDLMIRGSLPRRSIKRRKKQTLTYIHIDGLNNTCAAIKQCMRDLTKQHLKKCRRPGYLETPNKLQGVREYVKNTFHKHVHRINKDLGIEFSEIEELKTKYRDDLNRLRREHYDEMNNYEQELTSRNLSKTGDVNLQTELERIKENDRRLQQTFNDMIEDKEKLQQEYQQICQDNRELGHRTNDVNQQLQDSNAEILRLQQTLYDMRKDKEKLQQENQQICQENRKLHQQANDVDQQLQESNAEIHRLQEDIQKFMSTNDDNEKKIDKLRNVYLEEVFELEKVKNKVERLIKKAPDVLPEEYLRKTLRKCQATNRRSKVIKTLMKSQGNENHVPENEGDEINRQENTSSSDEDETVEDQDCRNEISSSMKMNKMETHTTVYNISTSNVNLNTHCTVKQCDGVLSVEPGDPGLPMLTENES